MWIACILREIELMTLVDAMYIGYIDRQRMLCKPPSYANYGNSNLDHRMHVWRLGYLLLASLRCYLSFKTFYGCHHIFSPKKQEKDTITQSWETAIPPILCSGPFCIKGATRYLDPYVRTRTRTQCQDSVTAICEETNKMEFDANQKVVELATIESCLPS